MTLDDFKQTKKFKYKGDVFEHHSEDELIIKNSFERFLVEYDQLGFTLNKFFGKLHFKTDLIFYNECEKV